MHESEESLEDRVENLLVDAYGRDCVARQFVFPTARRVDLLVDVGIVRVAIECENDADSVVAGAGQAIMYANHDPWGRTIPAVVVPDGHAPEDPERAYLDAALPIFEESELAGRLDPDEPAEHSHSDT